MRFNPVISIILGFIIALVCSGFLKLVTGVSGYTIGVIGSLDGAFASEFGNVRNYFADWRINDAMTEGTLTNGPLSSDTMDKSIREFVRKNYGDIVDTLESADLDELGVPDDILRNVEARQANLEDYVEREISVRVRRRSY